MDGGKKNTVKVKLRSVNPWENIHWSDEYLQVLYRDLGLFYTHKQQLDLAVQYYNKSLELAEDDSKALYQRSRLKRNLARTNEALDDSLKASRIDPNSALINLEICDALYESNQFEDCKVELHDNTRKYSGRKVSRFLERLTVVDENFKDMIGDTLGPFILRNEHIFSEVLEDIERRKHVDLRPLWRILKEEGKCDVQSVLHKEEPLLPPREIARRERAFKVFNQLYFNRSWIDMLFLKELRKNPNMLLPQSKVSTPYLRHLSCIRYDVLKKFLKMLHARSPFYNEHMRQCPDKKIFEKQHEDHLNRIQYQTRRNMITILRSIRALRKKGSVDALSKYVEEVMGDYVVLKTHRVMPWKFEFTCEVYNTLALAHADIYRKSVDNFQKKEFVATKEPLVFLLGMQSDRSKDRGLQFVFGDRSTYQEADSQDNAFLAYKKLLARLEKRMHFAKYGIERCYLLHEIARSHLTQGRFDECCSVARKAVEESKQHNSNLWQFLSTMLSVKAHAAVHKVERGKECLEQAYVISKLLKCPDLTKFINLCRSVNDYEISMKKRSQSIDNVRRRRSTGSMISRNSSQTSRDPSSESQQSMLM